MKRKVLFLLSVAFTSCLALAGNVQAQDFYGEGNVLIAVDMAPYAENEEVNYPENTMGTLVWGDDAPTGESTRPAFNNKTNTLSDVVTTLKEEPYEIERTYTVGQKLFFPYSRDDDPECAGDRGLFKAKDLPKEVFSPDGTPLFTIGREYVKVKDGETCYSFLKEDREDGKAGICEDFIEIECVAVGDHCTLWRYTGYAVSNRTGFDIEDYAGKIDIDRDDISLFIDGFDEIYEIEKNKFGDPNAADRRGDRDGKAAYLVMDYDKVDFESTAYYEDYYTDGAGFDCVMVSALSLPDKEFSGEYESKKEFLTGALAHELTHYTLSSYMHDAYKDSSIWLEESFADSAAYYCDPDSLFFRVWESDIISQASKAKIIPGMLWGYGTVNAYPRYYDTAYDLGNYFLRYIEKQTTGTVEGRLLTDFLSAQGEKIKITADLFSDYLVKTTGEDLDAWMAQFMAAVVIGDDELLKYRNVDSRYFYRTPETYGKDLGLFEVADRVAAEKMLCEKGLYAVSGGGTTYAYRNDKGGKIAITGADERWYFFALDIDDQKNDKQIEISSAEELAKIGHDEAYPLNGRYVLTDDIDLGGKNSPWTPIGESAKDPFTGEFNGNGHTVRGLYIQSNSDYQGLFGFISDNACIKDLTVYGSVTGKNDVGMVGKSYYSEIRNCTSYVKVKGKSECGGIVGIAGYSIVSDCVYKGSVTGNKYVAGIVGETNLSEIKKCKNTGTVTAKGSESKCCGGIVGYAVNSRISRCKNIGAVSGQKYVGGISGASHDMNSKIYACIQKGSVKGKDLVGGITGQIEYGIMKKNEQKGKVSGEKAVGLIAGKVVNSELKKNSCDGRDLPVIGLNNRNLDAA